MAVSKRQAFVTYLRTGRHPAPVIVPVERKFNHNHDPHDGRFTGAEGGPIRPGAASLRAAEIAERVASGRKSKSQCYQFVKKALQQGGAVQDYLPGIPAKLAGPDLAKRGFVNILHDRDFDVRSPYDAPAGSVLVYDPTPDATVGKDYGHIEIRTRNGFASDFFSRFARTGPAANGLRGKKRVLIGVWIKP